MEKVTGKAALNETKKEVTETTQQSKAYQKPQLTRYGSISNLVLSMPGAGMDGGFPPSITLT